MRTVTLWILLAGCGQRTLTFRVPGQHELDTEPLTLVPDPVLVGARAVASDARTCARPADRERLGPYELRVAEGDPDSLAFLSGGVLAGDLDDDGYLDLIAPLEPSAHLYRGSAGAHMTRWDERLSSFDLSNGTGGSIADADGDGDLDVLVLRYNAPAVLLRNDGPGVFTDASLDLPVEVTGPTTSSAWADIDADGDLDLFVGSYGTLDDGKPGRSYLFENAGDGSFYDRSSLLPRELNEGFTRVGGFHDLDGDAYPDLYVVNDAGSVAPNVVLHNHYGNFELDDSATGLDLRMAGGGLGAGDVNGDGVPDFLIPQWDDLTLMLSDGEGHWVDHASQRGLQPGPRQRVGWGAELADVDNDGDLDGVVAYGTIDVDVTGWDNPENQPDALFLQQPDGAFVDVAEAWGVADDGKNRGVLVADFDGDGWLDLAKRDLDGPSNLYVSRCGREHWLKVRLLDDAVANRNAIGARVAVTAGGQTYTRWVTAGGTGYGTGGPPEVHVGLGDATEVERIEVRWPDGALSWTAYGSSTDQTITVIRE